MLDPTLISRDMSPADVLAAMLPVVREAFAPPWTMFLRHAAEGSDDQFVLDDDERAAVAFASHVLPSMVEMFALPRGQGILVPSLMEDLADRLTAFRDAWCDAAEQAKEVK